MKKQITFVIILVIAVSCFNLKVNASEDFEKAMKKAKKNLKTAMNKSDESLLKKSRGEFERILQLKEDQWLVNYYIAYSDYGLALNASIKQKTDNVKKFTQSGIDVINKSIDANPEFADAFVLLEALNFNRWQYEQDKMQDIISATQSAEESATKLEPGNPRLMLMKGIAHFYTPEAFGGGPKVSIPEFEKSISLFEKRKEKSDLYPDWGNDLALGYMALSLIKRNDDGDMIKAKTFIDNAVKINPDSGFINAYVMDEYKKNSGSK
jgi:tetratricopeptide (TPR) repeat protein